MPQIPNDMLLAIRRKKGELNLTTNALETQTGISRWTLGPILSGKRTAVRTETVNRLNNWLYQHI